jgi:uncharacterized phage protein gp47/JayE
MAVIYKPKDFEQIYNAMKQWLIGQGSSLNNFNEGARLSVLLEAISNVVADNNNDYYQALKVAILTSVYNSFGFPRKAGSQAAGKLEFKRATSATQDYSIEIGTKVVLDGINFETISAGNILTGNTSSGQIDAIASKIGEDGNIDVGAIDTLIGQGSFVTQPEGIESATNPVAFAGGTGQESDASRIERFNTFINSLARAQVSGLIAGTLTVEGIVSASVVENFPSNGWNTIYADDGSGILTAAKRAEIEKVINGDETDFENFPGYRAAGITVQVLAPVVQNENFTLDIKVLDSSLADPSELETTAQTTLETYVNTLRLGQDVILSEITKQIKNANSEIYDIEYTLPTANITITSEKIARTGTVTVTSSIVTI